MNGIRLVFEASEISLGQKPATFEALSSLIEQHYPHIQVSKATYIDDDGDLVLVSTTKDLAEAYRLCEAWRRPELVLTLQGKPLTVSFMTESLVQQLNKGTEERKEPMEDVGKKLSEMVIEETKEPEIERKMERMRLEDYSEEERYLMCFKCNGAGTSKKGKPCKLCGSSGVINVATHPKYQRLLKLIREEIEATLNRAELRKQVLNVSRPTEVHDSVTCDGCGMFPISGPRFKCAVCDNFDFCAGCEDTKSHPHSFIKIRSPNAKPSSIVTVLTDETIPMKKRKVNEDAEKLTFAMLETDENQPLEHCQAGEDLSKVWKLRNDGKTWPAGCRLVNVSGAQGAPVRLPQLGPGEVYEVQVSIKVPQKPGKTESLWQAVDAQGQSFGPQLSLLFDVSEPEDRAFQQAQLLRNFLTRNPVLTSSILQDCKGNIEEANRRLAQLLA